MYVFEDIDKKILAQEQIKAKQKYLREEIIDKGYNSGKFVKFCRNIKGEDINAYTSEELSEVVYKFKIAHMPGEEDSNDETEEEEPKSGTQEKEKSFEEQKEAEIEAQTRPSLILQYYTPRYTENKSIVPPIPIQTIQSYAQNPEQTNEIQDQFVNVDIPPNEPIQSQAKQEIQNSSSSNLEEDEEYVSIRRFSETKSLKNTPSIKEIFNVQRSHSTQIGPIKDLSISVKHIKSIPGGVFSSTQIVFEIVTQPCKYQVQRKFIDFD